MSDWDAIFGEAALGLDLAKVDPSRVGSGNAPARRTRPPAGPATPVSAAAPVSATPVSTESAAGAENRPVRAPRPSLKLASRPTAPTANREAIFRREALEFRVRGRRTPGGLVRLGARSIDSTYRMLFV